MCFGCLRNETVHSKRDLCSAASARHRYVIPQQQTLVFFSQATPGRALLTALAVSVSTVGLFRWISLLVDASPLPGLARYCCGLFCATCPALLPFSPREI